jgi:hypothetical protein
MDNPIIERQERENEENGYFGEWRYEHLDTLILNYVNDVIDEEFREAEYERLKDMYEGSYAEDNNFEEYVEETYIEVKG